MDGIILYQVEDITLIDVKDDQLDFHQFDISDAFGINCSFRRGLSTHASNRKIPKHVIDAHNTRRKVERAKGRRAKFDMMESYADAEKIIPTLVH